MIRGKLVSFLPLRARKGEESGITVTIRCDAKYIMDLAILLNKDVSLDLADGLPFDAAPDKMAEDIKRVRARLNEALDAVNSILKPEPTEPARLLDPDDL